jgi:alpha-tubulin suppressor-like RCC1 family protein
VTTTLMSGTVTSISSGTETTCATASGKNYCWGEGSSGQLGNTASADATSPVAVSAQGALAGMTASDVATGATHSCGLLDGRPYCWGRGENGRLGNREVVAATFNYPQQTPPDALCAVGATPMGDGSCSLAPSTTYYYRVSYTLDGGPARTGSWVGISTS